MAWGGNLRQVLENQVCIGSYLSTITPDRFSSTCVCTAEPCRGEGIRHPGTCDITRFLKKRTANYRQISEVVERKLFIIPPDRFSILSNIGFLNVKDFFVVVVNIGPYGSKNFKTLLLQL